MKKKETYIGSVKAKHVIGGLVLFYLVIIIMIIYFSGKYILPEIAPALVKGAML